MFNTHGSLLKRGDGGGPETFTPVAQLMTFSFPELSREEFALRFHGQNVVRRLIGQILNVGSIQATVVLDPADPTHDASTGLIAAMLASPAVFENWQIVLNDAGQTTLTFSAAMRRLGQADIPVDGPMEVPVEFVVDGGVTFS